MSEIILSIIGGLVLFLYAVGSLSESLQSALGENARAWILRFTSNTWSAIATGTLVTMLLDSSSAVIIIAIVFINAGHLTFRQAMGIVLGANIGTTLSSQIIAIDVAKYSPILLISGFVLLLISRSERITHTGRIILYFGVLFFGLFTMENAVEPLREDPSLMDWLQQTAHPLKGAFIGAVVTLVIQSSSATVGMAIILAKKGLIGLSGGIAVMLGAELGTCSDTLLATIKGTRPAIKTALFHFTYSLLTIILGLIFFVPFLHFVEWVGTDAPVERSVANAHVFFNIFGVLVFVWMVPLFEKWLDALVPDVPVSPRPA